MKTPRMTGKEIILRYLKTHASAHQSWLKNWA